MHVSPTELDDAVAQSRKLAAEFRPPHERPQLKIDASALLATLKLPADVRYINAALNPVPDLDALLFGGEPSVHYATTISELRQAADLTGGLTNGQTSPLEPNTVYYDLRSIKLYREIVVGGESRTLADVLAHETVHLAQYADLQRAGKDPVREAVRSNMENPYEANPMERDAFQRAPALAHLLKVDDVRYAGIL